VPGTLDQAQGLALSPGEGRRTPCTSAGYRRLGWYSQHTSAFTGKLLSTMGRLSENKLVRNFLVHLILYSMRRLSYLCTKRNTTNVDREDCDYPMTTTPSSKLKATIKSKHSSFPQHVVCRNSIA